MQKWVDYLVNVMEGVTTDDNIKVSIVPFSGGSEHSKERPNLQDSIDNVPATTVERKQYQFMNLQDTQRNLDSLISQHTSEPHIDGAKFMGTTSPTKQLENAYAELQAEFARLKAEGNLDHAKFEFVYISDGVFKPMDKYYNDLFKLTGCDQAPPPNSCDLSVPHSFCTFCRDLRQNFLVSYGDPADSSLDRVATTISLIANLPKDPLFKGGQMLVHLVKLHGDRIPAEDAPGNADNLFDALFYKFPNLQNVQRAEINDDQIPFAIHPNADSMFSFQITNFFAINMNAYVDRTGQLVVDSDGDGVPDSIDSNATSPRSNGFCLDYITNSYGCVKSACDVTVDEVAGGLNQCDLKTIKPKDITEVSSDHDHDGLLNFHELIRGLNPNFDDSKASTAQDGFLDFQHFAHGIFPQIRMQDVPADRQVLFDIHLEGYQQTVNSHGQKIFTAMYTVHVNNIPLLQTLAVPEPTSPSDPRYRQFYLKTPKYVWNGKDFTVQQVELPKEDVIGPTPHKERINQLLFFARVQAVEDPTFFYWLMLRREVDSMRNGTVMNMDLNLQDFHQLGYLR